MQQLQVIDAWVDLLIDKYKASHGGISTEVFTSQCWVIKTLVTCFLYIMHCFFFKNEII